MKDIPQVCLNCANWHFEPTALDRKYTAIARRISLRTDVPAGLYGKCDIDNIGTFGQEYCGAFDHDNYPLFISVPED
jgi:hypothetical protein